MTAFDKYLNLTAGELGLITWSYHLTLTLSGDIISELDLISSLSGELDLISSLSLLISDLELETVYA